MAQSPTVSGENPSKPLKTEDFDFDLPSELIAQHPAPTRDGSRLLVADRRTGTRSHQHFSDLPQLLRAGDVLVMNNSRVIPARLRGQKIGGEATAELLLVSLPKTKPGGASFALANGFRPARALPSPIVTVNPRP